MSKKVLKGFAIFVLTMISGMITSNAFAGDVLAAVSGNGVSAEAQAEVAAILESLRPAVMGTSGP